MSHSVFGDQRRFSGRQITVMVIAVSTAVVVAPVVAQAASAVFSSSSSHTPAVSAKNSSSGKGAKALYGNASAATGKVYGVYGHANSSDGYGVYSAGRLGSSGRLVCSHCVTGGDVNLSTLPTVPSATNASKLGGNNASYYAHVVPLSWVGPVDGTYHKIADLDGLSVYGICTSTGGGNFVQAWIAADSTASNGTVNYFIAEGGGSGTLDVTGYPVDTTKKEINQSLSATQDEGNAIYRDDADGRIISIDTHAFGANCELFGDMITTG